MKPYVLQQTNWKQVESERHQVAILPWGATEPHNYHLPYGTDSLETTKIADYLVKLSACSLEDLYERSE